MPSGVYPQLNKKGQPHPAAGLNQQWFTAKGVVRTGFHLDEATGKYTSGRKTRAKDRTRFEGISTLDIGGEDVRVPKKTPLEFKVFQQDPKIGNYHAGDGPQFQLSKMNMIDDLAAEHGIFRTGILDAPLYKYGPQPPRADVGVMRNANLHIKGYGGASLFQTTEEYKAQQKASVVSSLRQPTLQGPQYQHLLDATKFKGKITKGFTPMTPFSEQAFDDKLARIKKKRLKVKEGSMAAYQPKTFKPTFDSPPPTPILVHEKQGPRMNKVSHREKMIADRERSAREDARLQRERDEAEKAEKKRIAAEKAAIPLTPKQQLKKERREEGERRAAAKKAKQDAQNKASHLENLRQRDLREREALLEEYVSTGFDPYTTPEGGVKGRRPGDPKVRKAMPHELWHAGDPEIKAWAANELKKMPEHSKNYKKLN